MDMRRSVPLVTGAAAGTGRAIALRLGAERALGELEQMTPAQRAAAPAPHPPEEIVAAVVELIRDEDLAGRVLVMWPEEPGRLLDPAMSL
jgi:hypothetical protein